MAKGHGKGSSFEREICKKLSLWWTKNKRNDVFWRTAGSGAMATTRKKTNGVAFGQYGDVQATDPIGQPLINICTIELKRGYSKSTFADIIETSTNPNDKPGPYISFIQQVISDSIEAKSYAWLLIVKRNRREAMIFLPFYFYKRLRDLQTSLNDVPCFYLKAEYKIFGTTLNNFLEKIKPKHIKSIQKFESPNIKLKRSSSLDHKEAQVFKCTSCDEDEVRWDEKHQIWKCYNCGTKNDYPK